jgi:hypothetical protein
MLKLASRFGVWEQCACSRGATHGDGNELQFLDLSLSPSSKRHKDHGVVFSPYGLLSYLLNWLKSVEIEEAVVGEGDDLHKETCNALGHDLFLKLLL